MQNIIKVKCLEEFKLYNNKGENLIADVKVGEIEDDKMVLEKEFQIIEDLK